jgi:hypothetical protein
MLIAFWNVQFLQYVGLGIGKSWKPERKNIKDIFSAIQSTYGKQLLGNLPSN